MFKVLSIALGLMTSAQALSGSCEFKVDIFSDDTCTTKATSATYPTGHIDYLLNFGECHAPPDINRSLKLQVCAEDEMVAFHMYEGRNCEKRVVGEPPVQGYFPDYCIPYTQGVWIKASNVKVNGNKYGLGFSEGYGIFVCQSLLFGACDGYE